MSEKSTWQQNVLFGDPIGAPGMDASFDFIIVGGGTGGLTIASRLAEDPNVSVAVIEAGGFYEVDNGLGSVIPALAAAQTASTGLDFKPPLIDWGFVTTPGSGMNGRSIHYARGKALGGSSAVNFMAYTRGTKGTYNAWADIVGDSSYNWDNLLPYFKKSTSLTAPDYSKRQADGKVLYDPTVFDNSYGGPLQVSWPNYTIKAGIEYIKAMEKAGIPETDAFDNGNLIGASWSANTINPINGNRCSSKNAFLERAVETTSIKVYTQTMAEKILFHGTTATGVLVTTDRQSYTLSAKKEVIVAAGTIQSPQLLMVSGIGPAKTLSHFSIPVISALEGVGKNLQDHCLWGISHEVSVETASRIMGFPEYAQQVLSDYMTSATGPLCAPHGPLGFEKLTGEALSSLSPASQTAISHLPADWPELEYLSIDCHIGDVSNIATSDPMNGKNYFTACAGLMTNLSRGTIDISSASVTDPPLIDFAYLTHPAEIEIAIAGFKRLRDIMDNAGAITVGDEYYPGRHVVQSDEQIHEFIKDNLAPVWHAAGTCAMGKQGAEDAVVDNKCRVFGTEGLRIVDASVFPLLPPCHPQATIYALAEKIADEIKSGL